MRNTWIPTAKKSESFANPSHNHASKTETARTIDAVILCVDGAGSGQMYC